MSKQAKLIPIYTSRGDLGGYLAYPYIFNPQGYWIGWVDSERNVYSVRGKYIGEMTSDPRIVRRREVSYTRPRMHPPFQPKNIRPPAHTPLAPQMPEIGQNYIDVLDEMPELLTAVDFGDLTEDEA